MSDRSSLPETAEPMPLPYSVRDLWETEIVPCLPAGLDEQAHALKAYQRYRKIERASDLLRALLAWVLGGCSVRTGNTGAHQSSTAC